MPRRWQRDRRLVLKAGERTGNRLDRKPKIVGDVLARHRQFHRLDRGEPSRHFEQEAGDAFFRGLHQEQHVFLDALKLAPP